jgi:hypothetical protein
VSLARAQQRGQGRGKEAEPVPQCVASSRDGRVVRRRAGGRALCSQGSGFGCAPSHRYVAAARHGTLRVYHARRGCGLHLGPVYRVRLQRVTCRPRRTCHRGNAGCVASHPGGHATYRGRVCRPAPALAPRRPKRVRGAWAREPRPQSSLARVVRRGMTPACNARDCVSGRTTVLRLDEGGCRVFKFEPGAVWAYT